MLKYFIPKGNYFFTPLLIYINVAIWLLMVFSGANVFLPSGQILVDWGSNYPPLTFTTQPWRLLTCTFLHVGIVHLVMNMIVIFQIGIYLEALIGRWRFICFYLLSGITASTVSGWWHTEPFNSAGASGAAFGIVGFFLAILSLRLLNAKFRQEFLASILLFIGYNIVFGLSQDHIDNSAHIGGLLSGLVFGYINYFDIRVLRDGLVPAKRFWVIAVIVGILAIAGFYMLAAKPIQHRAQMIELIGKFVEIDNASAAAEEVFFRAEVDSQAVSPGDYNTNVLQKRKLQQSMTAELKSLAVDSNEMYVANLFNEYASLRVEEANDYHAYLLNGKAHFRNRSANIKAQADELINAINKAYSGTYTEEQKK